MAIKYQISSVFVLLLLACGPLQAQEEEFSFEPKYDSPLTIDLDALDEENEKIDVKKKKPKRNVYYGVKTKKGFTRTGFGENTVLELFSYLKVYQEPDEYVRDIYWYNFKRKKIVASRNIDKEYAGILHGPYRKVLGDQVLEEGFFYKGTKHGRWVELNKSDILLNKEKYYKGWPRESKIAYWDVERTKMKEVIPIEYGEKEGYYYAFHANGQIAVMGEYKFDHKVGVWREYYPIRNRRKREVEYSKDPFDESFSPVILREWNDKGELIYDRERLMVQLK
ncbi:MAG: hypothetical protein RIF36_08105 [Imperialibacter sp.]|uniref:toxin-antitoxin system YwqK family antitoxin n=1 Tax=Imperialibacter sp. TaxID=2038411 RepID=UPI0032EC3B96